MEGKSNGRSGDHADPAFPNTNVTLLVNLTNTALEGMVIVPDDTNAYGPWAGKLLVGAETLVPSAIFAIDTNGVATRWLLNIEPEDFHIIPTNMNSYGIESFTADILWKSPPSALAGHAGDVLVTQEGDEGQVDDKNATYFILRWDAPSQSFLKWSITPPNISEGNFDLEQGVFAPLDLPAVPKPNYFPIPPTP
jgi:hypothetical protein